MSNAKITSSHLQLFLSLRSTFPFHRICRSGQCTQQSDVVNIIFCLENFFIVLCFSSLRKECFEQVFHQIKNALRYNCRHHKVSMYIVAPQVVILYFLLIQKYTHTLSRQLSTRTTNRVQAVFEIIAQELSDCLKWN